KSVGAGLGSAALASLLGRTSALGGVFTPQGGPSSAGPLALPGPHFPAKAKRVIYMHMEGAPSQIDLFDYKPQLRHRFNQDLPDSIRQGQRLTGMTSEQKRFPVAPSIFKFTRYRNNMDG